MKTLRDDLTDIVKMVLRERLVGKQCTTIDMGTTTIVTLNPKGKHTITSVEFWFIDETVFGTWDSDSYEIPSYEIKVGVTSKSGKTTKVLKYEL